MALAIPLLAALVGPLSGFRMMRLDDPVAPPGPVSSQ